MGLQGQLNDVGSDSIPVYLVALIAASFSHLRSLLRALLQPFYGSPESVPGSGSLADDLGLVGSGFADLILLSEQLSMNRDLSYTHTHPSDLYDWGQFSGSDCVVCLSGLRDGDRVRKLPCRHVFHKDCFEGWIQHMKFNCPLCRSPVAVAATDERETERRVAGSALPWFAFR